MDSPAQKGPESPRTEPRLFATWQGRQPEGGGSPVRAQRTARAFQRQDLAPVGLLGFLCAQLRGSWGDAVILIPIPTTRDMSTWQGPS